jgi:hypothetical protein
VPVVSSALSSAAEAGSSFSYQITATNSPTSFSSVGLPTGLSVNSANGLISGIPSTTGSWAVTIGASNSSGTGIATLILSVGYQQPVITSPSSATAEIGIYFSYQVVASGNPTSYSASGLPGGLSIDPNFGTISGAPTASGSSSIVINAVNSTGTGTLTLSLLVTPAIPVINNGSSAAGQTGVGFGYPISATNSPTSYGASGLPAGLVINTSTGLISGTVSAPGTANVVLSATNSLGTGTANLTLTFSATQENSLPYYTDFEVGNGFNVGPLPNQNGWSVAQGAVSVTSAAAYSGTQSIALGAGSSAAIASMSAAPTTGETVMFFDFYAIPAAEVTPTSSTVFTVEGAKFGYVNSSGTGVLQTFEGNGSGGGSWVPTSSSIALGGGNLAQSWVRLTVRLNFSTKTWDLYANGAMVAYDIGFINNASTYLSIFQAQGDPATTSYFDDIYIGTDNPLFADSNNDGINDAWEAANGLSPVANDRYVNISGDGSPAILHYVNGTSLQINTKVVPAPVQSGLSLHLRADAGVQTNGAGYVSTWFDQSGMGNNATQGSPGVQGLLVDGEINGLPALWFNGANEFCWLPPFMVGSPAGEILAVVRVDSNPNTFNAMWAFGTGYGSTYYNTTRYDDFGTSDTTPYNAQPASSTSQFYLYEVSVQAGLWTEYFNGTIVNQRTNDAVGFGSYCP